MRLARMSVRKIMGGRRRKGEPEVADWSAVPTRVVEEIDRVAKRAVR
jgi:hypothetical protein